jgi:hypothetical protein
LSNCNVREKKQKLVGLVKEKCMLGPLKGSARALHLIIFVSHDVPPPRQ